MLSYGLIGENMHTIVSTPSQIPTPKVYKTLSIPVSLRLSWLYIHIFILQALQRSITIESHNGEYSLLFAGKIRQIRVQRGLSPLQGVWGTESPINTQIFAYSLPKRLAISLAAARPAPMARITVAAPETISPPANTFFTEVSPFSSASM